MIEQEQNIPDNYNLDIDIGAIDSGKVYALEEMVISNKCRSHFDINLYHIFLSGSDKMYDVDLLNYPDLNSKLSQLDVGTICNLTVIKHSLPYYSHYYIIGICRIINNNNDDSIIQTINTLIDEIDRSSFVANIKTLTNNLHNYLSAT